MSTPTLIDSKLLPVTKITVEQPSGEPKVYDCVLDMNAIIKAEAEIGKDFSNWRNWQGLGAKEITVLVWSGLDSYHPEITLRQVRQWLAPAKWPEIWAQLIEQVHPGVLDALKLIVEAEKNKDEAPGKS
jgi:hypothetical protein